MSKNKNSTNGFDSQKPSKPKASEQSVSGSKATESKRSSGKNTPEQTASKQTDAEKKPPTQVVTPRAPRANYCKFQELQGPMRDKLSSGRSYKEISTDLGISIATAHKYGSLLSSMDGQVYTAFEEAKYIEKEQGQALLEAPLPADPPGGEQSWT